MFRVLACVHWAVFQTEQLSQLGSVSCREHGSARQSCVTVRPSVDMGSNVSREHQCVLWACGTQHLYFVLSTHGFFVPAIKVESSSTSSYLSSCPALLNPSFVLSKAICCSAGLLCTLQGLESILFNKQALQTSKMTFPVMASKMLNEMSM